MKPQKRMLISLLTLVALVAVLLPGATAAFAQGYETHVVQPGETLSKIARHYCTDWQEIYRINRDTIGSNPDRLEAGMVLTVPSYCGGSQAKPPSGVYDRGPTTHAAGTFRSPYYTAAWGDTLFSIGQRFGVPVDQIRQANGLGSGGHLQAGATLLIPGASGSGSAPPHPSPDKPSAGIERVYFGHGHISATRAGIIDQGAPKRYILGGQAGRVLEIGTVSHGEALRVTVISAANRELALNGENGKIRNNLWASLPATGDYIVTVYPQQRPEHRHLAFDVTFIIQ